MTIIEVWIAAALGATVGYGVASVSAARRHRRLLDDLSQAERRAEVYRTENALLRRIKQQ